MEDSDDIVVVGEKVGMVLYGTGLGKGTGAKLDVLSLAAMEVCKSDGRSWRQFGMNH